MRQYVRLQITGCGKGLSTLLAFVRSLSRVDSYMTSEVAGADESFRTIRAFVGLLSGVSENVPLKISQLGKTSLAYITGVWFLASMYSIVNL